MWDILYYNGRLGLNYVINGWNKQSHFPNIGDEVKINGNYYVVTRRMFDYDKAVVHIVVKVRDF